VNRRKLLATVIGVSGAALGLGAVGISQAATSDASGETTVEPAGGAGIFDVDPDQANLSQDPNSAVDSDLDSLPEDVEF
jgi:hypothetical protein